MSALTRFDLAELVNAALYMADVAHRYDPKTSAFRIARDRLAAAADRFGDPDDWHDVVVPPAARVASYAFAVFTAVLTIILLVALYGLGRAYGWWGS